MKILLFLLLLSISFAINGQELYVSSEPASNMPSKSIGFRLNNEIMPPYRNALYGVDNKRYMFRQNAEVMLGLSKKWMFHFSMFSGTFHQSYYKFEGINLYTKFRFLSKDNVQSHFRMAAYAKAAVISNDIQYNDINLQGDNSGFAGGIIATQLLHKFALSFTGGYNHSINNLKYKLKPSQPSCAYNYSFSAGYLLFPFKYKNYRQTNINLYFEMLGKTNPQTAEHYIDMAPAIQFIINSRMRLEMAYKRQLAGNMLRINNQSILIRFEYNIFNAYK
ncbi:MAG: hypothetical protein SGJ10_13050 [Bacteroidota bacterium]|nr:hypothetical protein [Bacteroidota bacterium]